MPPARSPASASAHPSQISLWARRLTLPNSLAASEGRFRALSQVLRRGMFMLNLFQSNTTTVVYIANNGSNGLLMTTSTDLITWSKSTPVPGQSSRMAPAIVSSSGGFILVAYVAANGSNDLLVVQQDGDGPWSKSTPVNGQSSKMAPALSVTPNNPMIATPNKVVLTYVDA